MIKITVDTSHSLNALLATQKQVRFAAKNALNNVAFKAMRDGRAHVQSKLNKPTPWTVKAWYLRRLATKTNLSASVGWSDYLSNKRGEAAEYYLGQHWTGGKRKQKAYEAHMQRTGLLPAGYFTVPGKAAEEMKMIDGRGNFKGGAIVAIMSGLGAFDQRGFTANASVRQSKKRSANKSASKHVYWAGKPGKNTPHGIWALDEKYGKGRGRLRPIMIFVSRTKYRKRLDLDNIAASAVATFDNEFRRAMANAMATAR